MQDVDRDVDPVRVVIETNRGKVTLSKGWLGDDDAAVDPIYFSGTDLCMKVRTSIPPRNVRCSRTESRVFASATDRDRTRIRATRHGCAPSAARAVRRTDARFARAPFFLSFRLSLAAGRAPSRRCRVM